MRPVVIVALLAACAQPEPVDPKPSFPPPDAWGGTSGPAGPAVPYADLFEPCAYLPGGPEEAHHHNHAVMYDGYLVVPWAPEDGGGGLTLWDFDDPCAPAKVGEAYSPLMRESHTLGFATVEERDYVAVNYLGADGSSGGVGFWDITDRAAPVWAGQLEVPRHQYPDSYTRLALSVTWQGDYVYVSNGILGIYIVDASDPTQPTLAGHITFEGPHVVGRFDLWGNLGMASSAGLGRTVLLDLSDPLAPVPIPGGEFTPRDEEGDPRFYYFANVGSHYALFARSEEGGGPMVVDISDPSWPTPVSALRTPDGDGGYVFQHEELLFVGDSEFGDVYDFSDPTSLTSIGRFELRGDLDTVTPIGSVAIVSVDERAIEGQASGVFPWTDGLDERGPRAGMTSPKDGDTFVSPTSRIGVVFDEMIEPVSAFEGSFRVWSAAGDKVSGRFNVQENIVNFTPDEPLMPDMTYHVELPAGGLVDLVGNPVAETTTLSFSTGGTL